MQQIIHQGRSIHLWELKLWTKRQLISICKLTNMILPKKIHYDFF
jgi:acyl-coenzyme A thioesterase PaaI-like protein